MTKTVQDYVLEGGVKGKIFRGDIKIYDDVDPVRVIYKVEGLRGNDFGIHLTLTILKVPEGKFLDRIGLVYNKKLERSLNDEEFTRLSSLEHKATQSETGIHTPFDSHDLPAVLDEREPAYPRMTKPDENNQATQSAEPSVTLTLIHVLDKSKNDVFIRKVSQKEIGTRYKLTDQPGLYEDTKSAQDLGCACRITEKTIRPTQSLLDPFNQRSGVEPLFQTSYERPKQNPGELFSDGTAGLYSEGMDHPESH